MRKYNVLVLQTTCQSSKVLFLSPCRRVPSSHPFSLLLPNKHFMAALGCNGPSRKLEANRPQEGGCCVRLRETDAVHLYTDTFSSPCLPIPWTCCL